MSEQEVKEVVAKLLNQGKQLQEVQTILEQEYKYHITFMELRLLSADIEVNWSQFDLEEEENEVESEAEQEVEVVDEVQVTKSSVVRPNAMMNGSFVAPSGSSGEWVINAMGQLEIQYLDEQKSLTEEETQSFQQKLRELLSQP